MTWPFQEPSNPLAVLVGVGLLAIGLILAFTTWRHASRSRELARHAQRCAGRVIGFEARRGSRQPVYHPEVEYWLPDGRRQTFVSDVGSRPAAHTVGDAVTVLAPHGDYEAPVLDTFWELWGAACLLGVLTAAFCGAGLLLMLLGWVR
jgi:hypothetical protein